MKMDKLILELKPFNYAIILFFLKSKRRSNQKNEFPSL